MIHALDYYNNQEILRYIRSTMSHIKSREEREDCNQEIFAELYDFMPLDMDEAKRIIKRVSMKFERSEKARYEHETGLV